MVKCMESFLLMQNGWKATQFENCRRVMAGLIVGRKKEVLLLLLAVLMPQNICFPTFVLLHCFCEPPQLPNCLKVWPLFSEYPLFSHLFTGIFYQSCLRCCHPSSYILSPTPFLLHPSSILPSSFFQPPSFYSLPHTSSLHLSFTTLPSTPFLVHPSF